MVEYSTELDAIFHSLADPIRRDILQSVTERDRTISELVQRYEISFAAVSKHVKVLEHAQLIRKRREGRKHMVALEPATLKEANEYLERYRRMWEGRYSKLDQLLKEGE
jgi:DNA-binding transcriptional ArsR family regulator